MTTSYEEQTDMLKQLTTALHLVLHVRDTMLFRDDRSPAEDDIRIQAQAAADEIQRTIKVVRSLVTSN